MWPFTNILRSFFLKEQVHIGQVSDSGAVDSRLHVYYSQIQLPVLIHTHLWSHRSLILKQKQLYLKGMQDFVQLGFRGWTPVQTTEKAIKCICNQRGKVYEITTSLPVYSQELFIAQQHGNTSLYLSGKFRLTSTRVCSWQIHSRLGLVYNEYLQSITLAFVFCFGFFLGRK